MKTLNRIIHYTTYHPIQVLLLNCMLFIVCLFILPGVKVLNTTDNFLLNDADKKYYDQLKAEFKNNEFFLVGVQTENVFTDKNLRLLLSLSEQIENVPGVQEVRSLATVDYIVGSESDFTVRKFLSEDPPYTKQQLDKLKVTALEEKFYVPALISADGTTAGIIGFVDEETREKHRRKEVMDKIHSILASQKTEDITYHVLGWTATDVALSDMMMSDLQLLFPLCFTIMVLCIFLIFRNKRLVLIAAACMLGSTIATLGAFSLTGVTINNLTGAVLPLCLSMALADIVHLMSHLNPEQLSAHKNDKYAALVSVQEQIITPCLFTSVTTGLGFLSLMSCGLDSMKDFAYISALAMLFEFYFTFFLAPQLLLICSSDKIFTVPSKASGSSLTRALSAWAQSLKRHTGITLLTAGILLAIATYQLFQVPVETDLTSYLKPTHPLRKAIHYTEPKLGGTNSFNISLRSKSIDEFKSVENLNYIEKLQAFIENIENVSTAHSLVDFLKDMNKSFYNESDEHYLLPQRRDLIEQYLLLYDGKDLDDFVNADFNHTRIVIRISPHSIRKQKDILSQVQNWIEQHQPPHEVTVQVTGDAVNNVNTATALVDGQMKSFAIALLLVGVLLAIAFQSLSWGLFSLIPNIIPVLLTFGLMGIFQIPLDTGTIMVASISLGIACDDTLHFIFHYRERRETGDSVSNALLSTLTRKGSAIIISSIILSLGFGILFVGSFVPIIYFGLLCSVTMISALYADIAVLPAILQRWGHRQTQESKQ